MTDIAAAAARLTEYFGPDPQEVGAEDGTEDDYGDLLLAAAEELGHDFESMPDEDWQHFQLAALNNRATTFPE